MSPSSLGYFQIDLLDKDASPVSNPNGNADQVHSVRVRFSVVSPFQNAQTFPRATHVGSVLLVRDQSDASVINTPSTTGDCKGGGWKQLTDGTGTPLGCAAACMHMASGGNKGSDNCMGGPGGP
ncbi:hypothetical protein [Salinibacter ruber]|uniref:hypothetical protein n=1 Tax=Salinibacter ruber TaxID=146919 RepID=UPI00216A2198|nr:hypothetical protein [Salinibacter ruber]